MKPQCTEVVKKGLVIKRHLREKLLNKEQEEVNSFAMKTSSYL